MDQNMEDVVIKSDSYQEIISAIRQHEKDTNSQFVTSSKTKNFETTEISMLYVHISV